MPDEAIAVPNEQQAPTTAPPVPASASEPSLLLVGALATVGIVALCGAALYFWPKTEETKRPVRPRRPQGTPQRLSGPKRRKSHTKTRPKPTKRRRPRRRKPMKGLPVETTTELDLDPSDDE